MRLRRLIVASIFMVGVTVQGTALADTILANTDLPGNDYRNMEIRNSEACRSTCLKDGKCEAWTYVKPGLQGRLARCWLKDSVPRSVHSSCCWSGTRAQRID